MTRMPKTKFQADSGTKPVEVAIAAMGALSHGADSFAPEGADERLLRPGNDVEPLSEAERLKATQAATSFGSNRMET